MTSMKHLSLGAAVLAIVLLSGCMVGPNYSRPDSDVNDGWIEGQDLSVQRDTHTDAAWWKVFDDPVLTRLVESAYRENLDLQIAAVRVLGAMAQRGVEVIIGTKYDDQFGPIIMYGLGGVMVEILKDISFRVLPISRRSARNMIGETKSAPILKGVRGEAACDEKSLVELLLLCSDIVESYPEIHEMDLNPVIVRPGGLSIADARVILKEEGWSG